MKEASTDPEFISMVEKIGNIMYYLPPDGYKKMVLDEIKSYTELSQKVGIK
jgi:tripartite-type tricarboxylate transporter receptor subunit TctC